ncbi:MAG: hypothetical protein Tsb0015_02580 [Simkaniaceae bacterium]
MPGYLIAEEGPLTGLIVRLEEGDEWIIGRDPDVAFQALEDPMVSRKHVVIRLTEEGFAAENLSAVNPASINGEPLLEAKILQEDDVLQVGNTLFRFSEHDPLAAAAPAAPPSKEEAPDDEESFLEEELGPMSFGEGPEARWILKVVSGPNTGAEFGMEAGKTYILGKDPETCDIVFQDLSVSRQHARLSVDDEGEVTIEDLNSRNGIIINGTMITEPKKLQSQDLIGLGTTGFLAIDRELTRETIFSPAPAFAKAEEKPAPSEEELKAEREEEEKRALKRDWKQLIIPTKHLVVALLFAILIFIGFMGMITLFKSQEVMVEKVDENAVIRESISHYPTVEFSFTPATGKIFLLGHVLTGVDHQELIYTLKTMPYITAIEDNIIIDELLVENFNALLMKNPNWRSVALMAPEAGKFALRGYVDTQDVAANLIDYVQHNFPYLDRLKNKVVVEKTMEAEIQSILLDKNFANVTFQYGSGELILAGRVNETEENNFQDMLHQFKQIEGIKEVKNFVVFTTASTTRIDLSDKYRVTGTSKFGNMNQFVVINGKILSAGDNLDGMLITNITSNQIDLEKDGIKYKINYNQQ